MSDVTNPEEAIVRSAERLLDRLGYVVAAHVDPERVLAEFEARSDAFAAVVTDLTMRCMGGPDLAARMRARRPDIPVIVASRFMAEADVARARRVGATGLMDKPMALDGLAAALAHGIGGSGVMAAAEPTQGA